MREPDREGSCGKAWLIRRPSAKELATSPNWAATVASWLLYVPGAHPMWHSYALAVVHLREVPGAPPPHKTYPDAEYELMIYALNPKVQHDPDDFKPAFLQPANLVEQFHGLTDSKAAKLAEQLAAAFVNGDASPDTDFRTHTRQVLRDTIEHLALGGHPQGNA
jgi:hypothetical protein